MLLSIVIRCLNRLEYTIRTIASIDEKSGLSKDDYEIICVEQGSADGTLQWLKFNQKEGYYPIKFIPMFSNFGDGKGMQAGINMAKGEFIAQHDNDIEIKTPRYFRHLINSYIRLEDDDWRVCAVAGSHEQGINKDSAPWRFGRIRYGKDNYVRNYSDGEGGRLYIISWVTGSLIFKKEFTSQAFGSGACNAWCGSWWDRGYNNFLCEGINFWHIDSDDRGGEYVKRQAEKFPSYGYVRRHYGKFI